MAEMNDERAVALYREEADKVHPLARFGESRVVRAFASRIMALDNRKVPLNEAEAMLTAQAAIATKLDPFPPAQELWSWVQIRRGEDGKEKRILTIMRGRDGTLKNAKKNAKNDGTHLFPPRYRLIEDEAERARRRIPKDAMAFDCKVEDYLSMTTWTSAAVALKDIGLSPSQIMERLGDAPGDGGLGILTIEEMKTLDRSQNKMTHEERCQKRAFIAALRKRWAPQEYGQEDAAASSDTDDYIIEGEWLLVEPEVKNGAELHQIAKDGAEALFGGGMEGELPEGTVAKGTPRPHPPETVRNKWKAAVVKFAGAEAEQMRGKITLRQKMAWQLRECFPGDEHQDDKAHSVIGFLTEGRTTSSKDLTGPELIATERWLDSEEPEGPGSGFVPRKESRQEAALIVTARMKELGQEPLL